MEQFILQHENIIYDDLTVSVKLYPINAQLTDKIVTYKSYNNISEATADLSNFKTESTPILYEHLDDLENSPKTNYYL